MSTFTGTCARGHDRVDFTDPDAWTEHFVTEHGRRPLRVGGATALTQNRPAPMRTAKPHPWKPARPQPDADRRLAEWAAMGEREIGQVA